MYTRQKRVYEYMQSVISTDYRVCVVFRLRLLCTHLMYYAADGL